MSSGGMSFLGIEAGGHYLELLYSFGWGHVGHLASKGRVIRNAVKSKLASLRSGAVNRNTRGAAVIEWPSKPHAVHVGEYDAGDEASERKRIAIRQGKILDASSV